MKILPAEKIREADAYTIEHEPIADIDLMERAAGKCADWLFQHIPSSHILRIVAGTGNNGGDGLAIARILAAKGYRVDLYLTGNEEQLSPSCRTNLDRYRQVCNERCRLTRLVSTLPVWENTGDDIVVIDAIFGNGLTRPVSGFIGDLIREINSLKYPVISIDVPSGLFIDQTITGISNPAVIRADYTLTFAPPKLSFFFPENDRYIGKWILLDIGLSEAFLHQVDAFDFMITASMIKPLLRSRNRYAHKGIFGHAMLICGGRGKMGAAVLAAKACVKSGAGLVTVRIPSSGVGILQTSVPEAMLVIDPDEDLFSESPEIDGYTAIGIGPGIGLGKRTQDAFKHLIQEGKPLIIDADALNILGENKTWLSFLPPGSILTPHPKEFERIAGPSTDDFHRHGVQLEFSRKYACYVILKGAFSAITTPDGLCFFNTTGNPGMATGGSGDVLTGMITGLVAQQYSPLEACLLGVYLHGLAGDLAAKTGGEEALTASDIINQLGNAFLSLHGKL